MGMIKSLQDLRDRVNTIIKVIPNNSPSKTQASDVRQYLLDEIDSVEDLVKQLGLSISTKLADYVKAQDAFTGDYTKLTNKPSLFDGQWNSLLGKPTFFNGDYSSLSNKPDLTKFKLNTDSISYNDLTNKPTIPSAPDLTPYALKSQIPTVITSYNDLTDKPTIPTYNLSLYRLKADTVSYVDLANKPSMSKLLWNQTSAISYLNSATETNVLIAANGTGTLNIDANPIIGTAFRFTGRGLFNTQTAIAPTLTIKLYLGNVVIASGSVSSLLIGAVNRPLSFYIDILIANTNTLYTQGSMTYFGTVGDVLSAAPITNNGAYSTVDLSIMNQLKMTLTWSTANTSNQIQMKIMSLEKLNN